MLEIAVEREVEGDVCLHDLGHGLPLRPGAFDGAISISAVQWLCNADTTKNDPRRRLRKFFESLYSSLAKGARAVLQIYPENTDQAAMMTNAAMRAGFGGGLVVDFPHSTKAKKYFMVLMVGGGSSLPQAKGMNGEDDYSYGEVEEEDGVKVNERRTKKRKGGKHGGETRRDWISRKKQQQRGRGATNVKPDTKYSGRKRKDRF
jgi:18S rRNA (guanine1575-N7)-methyltransferase